MKRILLTAIMLLGTTAARADFMFDTQVFYDSTTTNDVTYTQKEAHLFIGYPIGAKDQLYIGPNFAYNESNSTTGGTSNTEIGPRINYYFNADKTFKLALAYSPYVSTSNANDSASSFLAGIGWEGKINTNLYIGFGVYYHSVTTENDTSNTKDTVSTVRPMLNFSLRFR